MVKVKVVLKDISRTHQVEKEFASKAEEKVVKKPFVSKQTIKIDID